MIIPRKPRVPASLRKRAATLGSGVRRAVADRACRQKVGRPSRVPGCIEAVGCGRTFDGCLGEHLVPLLENGRRVVGFAWPEKG